jgi:CheY-like chemotaxis protein
VLQAEDNPVNSRLVTALLDKVRCSVVNVVNGREAVHAVRSGTFDLVLMDLQMPEMDGLEAMAAIRAAERGTDRHVPIIALTARALKGDREACLEAGADGYLSKPVREAELLGLMGQLLQDGKKEDAAARVDAIDFDDQGILERVGGDRQLLAEVVDMFTKESPRALRDIREAADSGDATRLERAAHKLRGSLLSLGADAAAQAAHLLEGLGRNGTLTGVQVRDLEREVEHLTRELERLTEVKAI